MLRSACSRRARASSASRSCTAASRPSTPSSSAHRPPHISSWPHGQLDHAAGHLDPRLQLRGGDRRAHAVVRAGGETPLDLLVVRRPGQQHDVRRVDDVEVAHQTAQLRPLDAREVPVDERHARRLVGEERLERLGPVGRLAQLQAQRLQRRRQTAPGPLLPVGDEYVHVRSSPLPLAPPAPGVDAGTHKGRTRDSPSPWGRSPRAPPGRPAQARAEGGAAPARRDERCRG